MKRKLIKFLLPICLLFVCLGFVACGDEVPAQLSAPENLRVEDGILYWDAVEYADGYSVYFNNTEYETTDCYFNVGELSEKEIYFFEVMAYSDKGITHSESAFYELTGKFALPTKGLKYELRDDKTLWVAKIAVDKNGVCVIPATYQGYKVTGFSLSLDGEEAFDQIKSLHIPYAFMKSSSFTRFHYLEEIVLGEDVENGETRWISEGNSIIDTSTNTLVLGCVNSVIPETVTRIGQRAFAGRRNITSFSVPEHIKEIEYGVFDSCTALKTLSIPPNTAFSYDWFYVVAGCTSLTEITIPKGITNLETAFYGCTSLKEVQLPEGVENLECAFEGCTSLERCVIPESVTVLSATFYGCTSLKEVVLPRGLQEIKSVNYTGMGRRSTFYKCTSLKSISLPAGLKSIGAGTFQKCTGLQSIEIPESVTSIGNGAFCECTSLQSITIPDSVISMEGSLFEKCASLREVRLPDGITTIPRFCFSECTSLTDYVIPETVTTIGFHAFDNCAALKSITIPETVTNIVLNTFVNCPLEEVFYKGMEAEWNEKLKINETGNETLLSATRYYYSETEPTEAGNFWHYVDGKPTKWAE